MEETRIIIAIVAVGVSLGGLVLTGQRATRAELVALRELMAHLEGLLEGLREAITTRRPAA